MANSGAIKAGRAFVELFADDSKLMRTLRSQEQKWKSVGKSVAGYGAMISGAALPFVGIFTAATKSFMTAGDQLNKMAARTGFAVEALSELGFAAEQSGADIELLETGLRGMQKFSLNASRGLSTAVDTLTELGLSAQDLEGKAPDEIFEMLAQAISEVSDPTKQAALSMQIFGRAGSKLLPMLQGGADGIKALRDQAGDLGLTVTKEDADNAAALTDAYNELTRSIKGGFFKVGAAIAPMLEKVADSISPVTSSISNWINENRGLFRSVFQVSAAIAGIGGALLGIGAAITAAGFAFGGLATAISVVGTIGAAALAALLSPAGLVAAAVAGVAFAFKDVVAQSQWFQDMADRWKESMGAIVTAIQNGEISKAWDVVVAGLKVEWVAFKDWVRSVFDAAWQLIIDNMPTEWSRALKTMAQMFDQFIKNNKESVGSWMKSIAKAKVAAQLMSEGEYDLESPKAKALLKSAELAIGVAQDVSQDLDLNPFQSMLDDFLNGPGDKPEGDSEELKAAKDALAKAIEEAKKPPKREPTKAERPDEKSPEEVAMETAKKNAETTRATEKGQVREQNTAVGSFSAFRIGSTFGTGPLGDISKHTRDTAKYTKQLVNQKGAAFT